MKKFENVSEYEILNAAWLYYEGLYLKECDFLKSNPFDESAERIENRYREIADELHYALVELRKCGNISD